jgi:hypothetical protein
VLVEIIAPLAALLGNRLLHPRSIAGVHGSARHFLTLIREKKARLF